MRIKVGDIVEIDLYHSWRTTRTGVVIEEDRKRPHVGYTLLVLIDGEVFEVLKDTIHKKPV